MGVRIGEVRGFWGFLKSHTAFVDSLDVRTAFDLAKPSVVSRIPTCMVTRGHVLEALLEGMQAVMVICFENCQTEFALHDAQGRAAWRRQVAKDVL